jgi:hypothetical protein
MSVQSFVDEDGQTQVRRGVGQVGEKDARGDQRSRRSDGHGE